MTGTRMKRMKFLGIRVTYPKTVYEPLPCHIRNIWFIISNIDLFFYESGVSTRSVIPTSSAISQQFRKALVDYHSYIYILTEIDYQKNRLPKILGGMNSQDVSTVN